MRYTVAIFLTAMLTTPALADPGPTLACFGTVHQSFPEQVPVSYVTRRGGAISYREIPSGYLYTTTRPCLASAPALIGRGAEAGCQSVVADVSCYAPDGTGFYGTRACYVAQPSDGSLLWMELGGMIRFSSAALSCVVGPPSE